MRDQPKPIEITIPPGVTFADLGLQWSGRGGLLFRWAVVRQVWRASGLPEALLDEDAETMVLWLIHEWYGAHLEHGWPADPVYEKALANMDAHEMKSLRGELH